MIKYVAGLLFDDSKQRVVLIEKRRGPAAVVGKLNAVGGKIDTIGGVAETSWAAMTREFREEAGLSLRWTKFLILRGVDWEVHFFHCVSSAALSKATTETDEVVARFRVDEVLSGALIVVSNLRWIIPMALGHLDDHVEVYEVVEKEVSVDGRSRDDDSWTCPSCGNVFGSDGVRHCTRSTTCYCLAMPTSLLLKRLTRVVDRTFRHPTDERIQGEVLEDLTYVVSIYSRHPKIVNDLAATIASDVRWREMLAWLRDVQARGASLSPGVRE
jgi:8-oxo-dGTP pyrophosphatase MutT (NUDIX family)